MAKRAGTPDKAGGRGSTVVDPAQIIAAAVRICDEDGIESLTIRGLATALNIGTMTLYSYFRGKEEILDAVADHVLGTFKIPEFESQSPAGAFRAVAHAFFAMMREHPSVVYLLASRATTSEQSMSAALEDVIGAFREAGMSDLDAVRAYGLVITYTLGFASYQTPRPWGEDGEGAEELRRQRRHLYGSLPLPAFRNMVELNEMVTSLPSMEQFDFGVECLVAGLLGSEPGATKPRSASTAGRRRRSR